jgi:hypothetical protein
MRQRPKVNNRRGAVHNCIGVGMTIVCGKGATNPTATAWLLLSRLHEQTFIRRALTIQAVVQC